MINGGQRGMIWLSICSLLLIIDPIKAFVPFASNYPTLAIIQQQRSENGPLYMAKKKGSSKKKIISTTSKGFGAPPPSLVEVASKFRNHLPVEDPGNEICPCGSGKTYGLCCEFYHKTIDESLPESHTPIDLLRSRYTAFAWRLPLYVMESTHPTCRDFSNDRIKWAKDLNKSGMFDSYEFLGLEDIGDVEEGENSDEAFVTFKVRMRAREDIGPYIGGQEIVIQEKSRFLRDGEPVRWRYASGDVKTEVAGVGDITLNS